MPSNRAPQPACLAGAGRRRAYAGERSAERCRLPASSFDLLMRGPNGPLKRDGRCDPWPAPYAADLPVRVERVDGGNREDLGMSVQGQIDNYIADQPQPKRDEMEAVHRLILKTQPGCRLWYLDGKNAEGKIVSNPNIGYGLATIRYAGGETREFYKIGVSANTT